MQGLVTFFTNLQTTLQTLAPIVAFCGIGLWFLMTALAPIMPEWAQNARGHVQRVLVGCILIGGAATLITQFMAMAV